MFNWFNNKPTEASDEATGKTVWHIYMSVVPVQAMAGYSPELYFHNYRGRSTDPQRFRALMEAKGHSVILTLERPEYEAVGGVRSKIGIYVDEGLNPVPKSEVI